MNRKLIAIIMVLVNGMLMFGCTDKSSIKESAETIPAQNELVISDGEITSGREVWDKFKKDAYSGIPADITIRQYYHLDKSTATVPIPQTETRIHYDGEKFYVKKGTGTPSLNTDAVIGNGENQEVNNLKTYKYLIERSGRLPNAAVSDHGFYLVNDDTLTYEQIQWSILSSQSSDWIDFYTVFIECVTPKSW